MDRIADISMIFKSLIIYFLLPSSYYSILDSCPDLIPSQCLGTLSLHVHYLALLFQQRQVKTMRFLSHVCILTMFYYNPFTLSEQRNNIQPEECIILILKR
jgi:hypothetical protein